MSARDAAPRPIEVVHCRRHYALADAHEQGRHSLHVLGLRVSGAGYYRLGPDEMPRDGRFLALLPAGEDDVNGLDGPGESWWTNFDWPALRSAPTRPDVPIAWAGRRLRAPRWKRLGPRELSDAVAWFEAMRGAHARGDVAGDLAARGWLLRLIGFFLDAAREAEPSPADAALTRFRAALEARAGDPVRIADLARVAGLSEDRLRELFAARYGETPQRFREGVRLARARELLAQPGARVRDAAAAVGYRDPLYFSRAFRKRFGVGPREFARARRVGGP